MLVCAHGDVDKFCESHDMVIVDRYSGDLEKYNGVYKIVVTDQKLVEYEYDYLKGKLFSKGIQLLSTVYNDRGILSDFVAYSACRDAMDRRKKYGGRKKFDNAEVVNRILELREKGYSYRRIRDAEGVCYPGGRKLSVSTIQGIIKDKERKSDE